MLQNVLVFGTECTGVRYTMQSPDSLIRHLDHANTHTHMRARAALREGEDRKTDRHG